MTPLPPAPLSPQGLCMTHTWGLWVPPAPAKNVFGLVWRQSRHTKPKTLESWRGAAAPVPVEGGKPSALPYQDAV